MPPPVLSTRPTGPYAVAFRSLVAYLKAHPKCSMVRSWRAWEGLNDDAVVPTADQCPWVRLTPMTAPANYAAFSQPLMGQTSNARDVVTPLKIWIETQVTDTNFDASALLWDGLCNALFPTDDAGITKLRTLLDSLKVTDMTLLQPALPTGLESFGGNAVTGDGSIQLDIVIEL